MREDKEGDRDTNQCIDKSQREEAKLCRPQLCEMEFFSLELGPLSQALTRRGSCYVCKHEGWEIGWLAASWQKETVVRLRREQRQQPPMAAQTRHLDPVCWEHSQTGLTLPRGISALWFLLPWSALIVIPHYLVKGGGMNHKLLQKNYIFCSERNPPQPRSPSHLGW